MTTKEMPDFSRLYQAISAVRSEEECASLMEDLCSQTELRAMQQRLEVAALLMAGETFLSIQQQLGVCLLCRLLQNGFGRANQLAHAVFLGNDVHIGANV